MGSKFDGYFDGNNHIIFNLSISNGVDENMKGFGLFGVLGSTDNYIKNLVIEDSLLKINLNQILKNIKITLCKKDLLNILLLINYAHLVFLLLVWKKIQSIS